MDMMDSTQDFLFLPTYHNHNLDNVNLNSDNHSQQRTPSPSSSSSSSDHEHELGMDPFYSSLLSAPTDLQAQLEMDLFPDAEALDTFSELQREEERLRDEMIFSSSSATGMSIHQFLQEGDSSSMNSGSDAAFPFQIEFNSESLSSNSPSSMFMMQNDNSTSSSSSSSFDMDLNIGGNSDERQSFVTTTNPATVDVTTTFVDAFTLSPCSGPIDSPISPPLTPGDIKVDCTNPEYPQILFTSGAVTDFSAVAANVLTARNGDQIQIAASSIHKSSTTKRGRSASNDDSPDVQALKRHIRMIRNRESASLSRKKKKEYVTGLEDRIKDLEKENDGLKKENQFLRSKLQQNGIKTGTSSSTTSSLLQKKKKKPPVGVLAKVALLGLFGFVMVNFHSSSRSPHHVDHHSKSSNLSQFSRTLTKLRLSEDGEGNVIPPLMAHQPKFIPRGVGSGIEFNATGAHLETYTPHMDGNFNYSSLGNVSRSEVNQVNSTHEAKSGPAITSKANTTLSTPTSYLNGTSYNHTSYPQHHNSSYEGFNSNWSSPHVKRERTREQRSGSSRWRSRGIGGSKKKEMLGWHSSSNSLKSANLVFPPFLGSAGVTNSSSNPQDSSKCPNSFNKTESMRVKSDLEDIFGKGKFSQKKRKPILNPVVKSREQPTPIVYSLISHTSNSDESTPKAVVPQKKASDLHGLAVYEGDRKKFSTILEKLERREDTFYVVSLALDNQLLLSAKASNDSSRPKMTLLLPWRNETLKEDMILQIDCEVFQVFNLNEKRQPQRQRASA